MSILRIVTGPADVGVGGYIWDTITGGVFDNKRVEGAFKIGIGAALSVTNDAPSGTETWYHFRYAQNENTDINLDSRCVIIKDVNSNDIAYIDVVDAKLRMTAVGDTSSATGTQSIAEFTAYSIDLHVIVSSTVTVRWYINGALYGEQTVANVGTTTRGVARSITFQWTDSADQMYMSELIIADEDTRGMRVRELRPKSFGIFQEWDGSISALRDTDLATGISTAVADRRVSFGITNIENVQPGDVINRVVAQTFAQKGETGLSAFNHFFRHKNGNVSDGSDQTLSVLGGFFLEEFTTNPDTAAAWQPEDFSSLQSGVRSRP
ncbi:hypothetical protein vBRpoSV10_13 [Ruegeria phage vB_RpoS-V10]|nr:hypothetical protein DSS3P8_014 [Roseobacter phage DSS3P8]AWY09135.1 hypothetical protein vBRpoSV10_13 [Ruegeria phage vB_RpoS-V10]